MRRAICVHFPKEVPVCSPWSGPIAKKLVFASGSNMTGLGRNGLLFNRYSEMNCLSSRSGKAQCGLQFCSRCVVYNHRGRIFYSPLPIQRKMLDTTPTAPLVLIGYQLKSNLMEHYNHPFPPMHRLIQSLQRELHIPITLVEVEDEDDDEDPTLFVCCYAECLVGRIELGDVGGLEVPTEFEKVVGAMKTVGGLRRLVCLSGRVYGVERRCGAREVGYMRI